MVAFLQGIESVLNLISQRYPICVPYVPTGVANTCFFVIVFFDPPSRTFPPVTGAFSSLRGIFIGVLGGSCREPGFPVAWWLCTRFSWL